MFETLRSVMRFRRVELNPARRRLAHCANVDDMRRVARRRLPRGVFDYIDGAAEDEVSSARNREAFERIEFRPRILRGVDSVEPGTTLLPPLNRPS